jgi:hypothetical protein
MFMCQCFLNFKVQDPAINNLRHKVRYALEENNPALISLWLSMEDIIKDGTTIGNWQFYCAQYKLLIDALSDDLLPKHWRVCCLDSIYRPLSSLHHLAIDTQKQRQLNRLYYELRVITHFFQSGLS